MQLGSNILNKERESLPKVWIQRNTQIINHSYSNGTKRDVGKREQVVERDNFKNEIARQKSPIAFKWILKNLSF